MIIYFYITRELKRQKLFKPGWDSRLRSPPFLNSQDYRTSMPQRTKVNFYLCWIENPKLKVRGWNIRVPYIDRGRLRYRRKLVSKSRYGGTKESLRAIAICFRNELISKLGTSMVGGARCHLRKSRRNTSGHIGVYCNVQVVSGSAQIVWSARWTDAHGKIVMKRFSVKRYGERKAKTLAIMARAEGVRHTTEVISQSPSVSGYRHSKSIKGMGHRVNGQVR